MFRTLYQLDKSEKSKRNKLYVFIHGKEGVPTLFQNFILLFVHASIKVEVLQMGHEKQFHRIRYHVLPIFMR